MMSHITLNINYVRGRRGMMLVLKTVRVED